MYIGINHNQSKEPTKAKSLGSQLNKLVLIIMDVIEDMTIKEAKEKMEEVKNGTNKRVASR